jgi:hypothetical protein
MATAAERQKAQATRPGFLLGHDLEGGFVERFADRHHAIRAYMVAVRASAERVVWIRIKDRLRKIKSRCRKCQRLYPCTLHACK